MKNIKNLLILSLMTITSLSAFQKPNIDKKMYLDENEVQINPESIYIHTGNNIWIETQSITRDATGLYTFESNINYYWGEEAAKKKWKCPYCYRYYDVGVACDNSECPSKY